MQIEIEIEGLKPIGLNNSYFLTARGGFATRVKKPETKEFEKLFDIKIQKYLPSISKLNKSYNSSNHFITIDYRFYIPVFTKKGLINKRSGDVDGLIKITQDCLFKHLSCDDAEVVSLNAMKVHSDNYKIAINISVKSIDSIK